MLSNFSTFRIPKYFRCTGYQPISSVVVTLSVIIPFLVCYTCSILRELLALLSVLTSGDKFPFHAPIGSLVYFRSSRFAFPTHNNLILFYLFFFIYKQHFSNFQDDGWRKWISLYIFEYFFLLISRVLVGTKSNSKGEQEGGWEMVCRKWFK